MNGVLVVTDSSACLPALGTLDGVRIAPISILLADREERDDTIEPAVVYRALARDEIVKSSPPTLLDYLTAIEHGDFEAAVVLTPSSEFTVMSHNARLAAELSARPVRVLDTATAAAAQGLVVLEAVEAARSGATLDEVVAVAEAASRRVELVATIESTETIERSGRVSSPALAAARRLGVRPLFRFRDGTISPVDATSVDDPIEAIRRVWLGDGGPGATRSAVFHATSPGLATRLQRVLGVEGPIAAFSPAMAIHTGPGVVGVAWLRSGAG